MATCHALLSRSLSLPCAVSAKSARYDLCRPGGGVRAGSGSDLGVRPSLGWLRPPRPYTSRDRPPRAGLVSACVPQSPADACARHARTTRRRQTCAPPGNVRTRSRKGAGGGQTRPRCMSHRTRCLAPPPNRLVLRTGRVGVAELRPSAAIGKRRDCGQDNGPHLTWLTAAAAHPSPGSLVHGGRADLMHCESPSGAIDAKPSFAGRNATHLRTHRHPPASPPPWRVRVVPAPTEAAGSGPAVVGAGAAWAPAMRRRQGAGTPWTAATP